MLNKYIDRNNFWEGIANANNLIGHNRPIDPPNNMNSRRSFFTADDEDNLAEALKDGIHFPCLVMLDATARLVDDDDVIRKQWSNALYFLEQKNTSIIVESDAIEDCYNRAETIMHQVISRMKYLQDTQENCGPFGTLDFNTFRMERTGCVYDNVYGWVLYFMDKHKATEIVNYNPNNWS